MKTSRPLVLTLAIVFLVLNSIGNLASPLLVGPPIAAKVVAVALGLLGLLAAYGLWNGKRWGMIVAIVVSAINALLGVPGLLVHPNLPVTLDTGVGIIVSVLIIVLTILPSARATCA